MSKVPDYQALVHAGFALDADAGPTPLATIGWVCVGGVHAERDGIGGGIDGDEACGDGGGVILVSSPSQSDVRLLLEI